MAVTGRSNWQFLFALLSRSQALRRYTDGIFRATIKHSKACALLLWLALRCHGLFEKRVRQRQVDNQLKRERPLGIIEQASWFEGGPGATRVTTCTPFK
tara:strand:+ start:327 stop:623 length:297 start_codon:yes stop_codon:yes gene_type:complete